MKKKTLDIIGKALQTETYMKGHEYMNWDAKSSYTYNFEIECNEIVDLIIMSANISKNRLTLYDGTEVDGLSFKLYPLDCKGERVSHYFISSNINFRVKKKQI